MNATKIKSYKDLDVWRKGIAIVNFVYDLTDLFPDKERFGLCSQMQRAAVSIPSNVAEGFSRQYKKEYQQFCYIARSSCAELETQLIIAKQRKYIGEEPFIKLSEALDHESRMLANLIKKIRESSND